VKLAVSPSSPYQQVGGPMPVAQVAANEWLPSYRALQVSNWDARNVDVEGYMAWATGIAKQAIPDAEFVRIDVTGVFPDGHADLTQSSGSYIAVRFFSPSRSKRDPSTPIGAQPNWHCMFQVMATLQTGPFIAAVDGQSCEAERPHRTPHCSIHQVWKQMISNGAPSQNAVATLDYFASDKDKPPVWYTAITGSFSKMLPDECP
jgi:hypothetical protein